MTKFKNHDLLMASLEKCATFRYYRAYVSSMESMQDMIINTNSTFEQAVSKCVPSCLRYYVNHSISRIYHRMIRDLNNEKFNIKKEVDNNE